MKFVALTTVILIVIISFQNCSDISIKHQEVIHEASIISPEKPTDTMCAPQGATFGAPVRIIIMIDMSASNIGAINVEETQSNGSTRRSYSLDTEGAADLNGIRFTEVKKFIENCGGTVNVKYAIMGFAKDNFTVRGHSCVSGLESQTDALKSIAAFKAMQDHDLQIPYAQGQNPYYLETSTQYTTGLGCIKQKINEDLALLTTERPVYHVFFLTDGQPTDPAGQNNYAAQLEQIKVAVAAAGSSLVFQPIFYTSPGANNQAEMGAAIANLNAIGGNPTLVLNDLTTANTKLCEAIQPESIISYSLKNMFAVNATARMDKSSLNADSDLDGVSDEEETSLGWNPTTARSTGVLDGLCKKMSLDKSVCQTALGKLTCTQAQSVLGLNDCDRKFSSRVFSTALTGVDTDKDLVPDLLELLKKTSPARADMFDNPSGDGITNLQKIIQGMDILSDSTLNTIDPLKLTQLSLEELPATCSENRTQYKYIVEQIPLIDLQAYQDQSDDPTINFSHKKDENIILVVSVWQSIGGALLPDRLYVQKILVPKEGAVLKSPAVFIGEIK